MALQYGDPVGQSYFLPYKVLPTLIVVGVVGVTVPIPIPIPIPIPVPIPLRLACRVRQPKCGASGKLSSTGSFSQTQSNGYVPLHCAMIEPSIRLLSLHAMPRAYCRGGGCLWGPPKHNVADTDCQPSREFFNRIARYHPYHACHGKRVTERFPKFLT